MFCNCSVTVIVCICACRDISHTALSSLPDSILGGLQTLIAESTVHLKELPPPERFTDLSQAALTYPSLCCAFKNLRRNRNRNRWTMKPHVTNSLS